MDRMGKSSAAKKKIAKKRKEREGEVSLACVDPAELTGRQKHQLKVDLKRSIRAKKCALQSARRAIPKATKAADEKEQRRALLSEIRALGKEPDAADTTEMDE